MAGEASLVSEEAVSTGDDDELEAGGASPPGRTTATNEAPTTRPATEARAPRTRRVAVGKAVKATETVTFRRRHFDMAGRLPAFKDRTSASLKGDRE